MKRIILIILAVAATLSGSSCGKIDDTTQSPLPSNMYVVTEKCTRFSLKSVPLERRGYYMYFICTCGEKSKNFKKDEFKLQLFKP